MEPLVVYSPGCRSRQMPALVPVQDEYDNQLAYVFVTSLASLDTTFVDEVDRVHGASMETLESETLRHQLFVL